MAEKDIAIEVEKQQQEAELTASIESELTDEQLLQLAEGSSSWGANCNNSC
jgi:hypothetical protein